MKKVISLLLSLVVILSCFSAVYADGFNYVFDGTDTTVMTMTMGHNVSVGDNWRTKTETEGKMGFDDNGWVKCADGRLYLGAVRAGAYETFHYRYNAGADFDNGHNMMSALVFNGDRTNMTAAQRIKLSALKNDNDGISWGIRFMVHNDGKNYYAIVFGGNDTYNDTKTGVVAYYVYKVENNTIYTPLKMVLTSDVDGKQITAGLPWANFELLYNNGNISFTCTQGDTVFKDSVTDTNNPYVLSRNDQTIWLTCTGAKETYEARHVAFKDISISNYDVVNDFVDGELKYDLAKYTDGSKTIATATLKGYKDGPVNATVNVPKYVEKDGVQYLVNRVADNAFNKDNGSQNVEFVDFDKTEITDFGANVFNGQQYLQTVTLPSTAESLGKNAFRGCFKLHSVNIPEKITTIEDGTFFYTSIYNQLTITFEGNNALNFSAWNPSNYEKPAFGYNDKNYIIKVCSTVPKTSIKSYMETEGITKYGFENYEKSVSGSYSDGTLAYGTSSVSKIAKINGAEQDISEKTAVVTGFDADMPVEYEEDGTTEKLKDIVIPENISVDGSDYAVTAVADNALYYDKDLPGSKNIIKTVAVNGANLKSIGTSSFRGQSNLTSVKLPESLTNIGTAAFKGCGYLKNINIPANVNEIKAETFQVIRNHGGSGAVFNIEGNKLTIDSNAFSSLQKIYFITDSAEVEVALNACFNNDTEKYTVLNSSNKNKIIKNGNELLFNVSCDGMYNLYIAGYNGSELANVKNVSYNGTDSSDSWISYILNGTDYEEVKAFIWKSETLAPLAGALPIK